MNHSNYSPVRAIRSGPSSESAHSREGSRDRPSPDPHPQLAEAQEDGPSRKDQSRQTGAIELQRSSWILVLASFFSILALSSWIILCILCFRPLTTNSYEASIDGTDLSDYHPHVSAFVANEKWYQAARFIQSIVAVLTLPLTSAVCSNAAVVFIQRHGKASNMTMRQLLALADKGWTNAGLYWQLVKDPVRCWRRYFTSFLLVGIALHVLGGLISPLQALLLSPKSIKVPSSPSTSLIPELIQPQFAGTWETLPLAAISSAAIPALSSSGNRQYDQQVWQSSGLNCTDATTYCGVNLTLGDLPNLADPFIAPLPNGFNTGVVRQYAPRLNSSVKAEFLPQLELPGACNTDRSFYIDESGTDWEIQVCAPLRWNSTEDWYQSPWENTRDRQDISEELFLSFKFTNKSGITGSKSPPVITNMLKITANTTLGWFELPNYMNSGMPGALQEKDPIQRVGRDAVSQLSPNTKADDPKSYSRKARGIDYEDLDDNIKEMVAPGSLLSLAYSIFGAENSFMATCATALNDTTFSNRTDPMGVRYCTRPPLYYFLFSSELSRSYDTVFNEEDRPADWYELVEWLWLIGGPRNDMRQIEDAFKIGLYLVSLAWMQQDIVDTSDMNYVTVTSDPGADTQVPAISLASIAVISALLSIYLLVLLSIASYAALSPRWVDSMNGFAMMRIGSAIADRVPLLVTYKEDEIAALDEIPGWIGGSKLGGHSETDSEEDDWGRSAQLELGASCRLRASQRYTCYQPDQVVRASHNL